MTWQQEPSFFAARATDIIVAACRSARRPTVLLPALYCAEVAAAVERAGLSYRCYDVPSDLAPASPMIDLAFGRDVGAVVTLHPFGLSRQPADLALPADTLVIEDACHALRTLLGRPAAGQLAHLTVYSPRKELGWAEGGAAAGPRARTAAPGVAADPRIEARWRRSDFDALAREGRRATLWAAAELSGKLPPLSSREVLLALPLKSVRRDATIERLRAHGVAAWRWKRPLKGTGPRRTPQSYTLRRKLLLVPLDGEAGLGRTLELLRGEPLEDWDWPGAAPG